ncbi:MAG: PA14 domain-containing protein, partial [Roseibacillus sp.]|nr:PA14 domain-containing protein [Roseibacillus sp.]
MRAGRRWHPPLFFGVALSALTFLLITSPAIRAELRGDWTDRKAEKLSPLTSFTAPSDIADKYDARIHGFIHPPRTGDYVFALTCDDQADLFLSTDKNPGNKSLIAHCPEWAEPGNYRKFPTQKSGTIRLTAGKAYYISAVHKENVGGDHLSVAWILPGTDTPAIIPGSNLSPYPGGR